MTTRGTSLLYYKIKTEGEEETILPDDGDCKVVRVKEEELTSTEDEDSSSDDKCKTRTRVSIKKEHNSNSDSENYDDQLVS